MFDQITLNLIATAQELGVKFVWVNHLDKGIGAYTPSKKKIELLKGISLEDAQIKVAHEIAHVLWHLSAYKGNRKYLKAMDIKLNIVKEIAMKCTYKIWEWEEERFAYYMEDRPELLLEVIEDLLF